MPDDLTSSTDPDGSPLPPFPVVGIGASSGGLSALLGLFEHMPVNSGMAYVLVLHVPPKDDENAVAILTRGTAMPVLRLTGPTSMEPDHVYVVPNGHDLQMDASSLQPLPPNTRSVRNTSVDQFFRTLADTYRARAIGVVLSGTGSDGAVGLARIREQGGIALAQAPEDADHSGMPRASIASGSVDFVLPVTEIPGRLIALWQNARQIRLPPLAGDEPLRTGNASTAYQPDTEGFQSDGDARPVGREADGADKDVTALAESGSDDAAAGEPDSAPALAGKPAEESPRGETGAAIDATGEQALRKIMEVLRVRTRHDFRHYKRATLLRRIARRLQVNGVRDLPTYHDYLRDHAEEAAPLLQDMLISVTNFFRDSAAMGSLERNVLPGLLKGRRADDPLRVWVVGCATGEEAYSISILLHEVVAGIAQAPTIQVFATDIDDRAIAVARNGLYPRGIENDVSAPRLREFFTMEADSYRVSKTIRESVLFASHNILHDAPFSRLDLILCRNLLIYLDREAQTSIIDIFRYALKPGGHLFLGTSETADSSPDAFTAIDAKNRIYVPNARPTDHGGVNRIPALASQPPITDRLPRAGNLVPVESAPPAVIPTQGSALELHQRMLLESAPPSVLVDGDLKILHMTTGAGRFMVHGSGSPSAALMSNVHPDLRLELRAALMSASESGSPVQIHRVPVNWHQGSLQEKGAVNLHVFPRRDPRTGAALHVVFFEALPPPAPDEAGNGSGGEEASGLADLSAENKRLKEQLQQTIRRFDTSSEELRASNTELASINDALRRATEELETKKEELQSMNEELIAVNHELKAKVDETGQIQDDLQNLSVAGAIIALFVDRAMNVKRFTPAAASMFGLSAAGPPQTLADIADKLDHASLSDDAAESFRTLRPIERRVQTADGRAYLARTQPYRTMRDSIDGAVLNLTDLTAQQEAEDRLNSASEILRLSAECSENFAVLTMDQHGRIDRWNADAERVFGYDSQEMIGQSFEALVSAEERARGAPGETLRSARERGRAEAEQTYRRKDGSTFHGKSVIAAVRADPLKGFVQTIRDLSEVHQVQAARDQLVTREQSLTRELHASRRTQDELFEVLSGELKRPLNLIQVNADMLMRLPETRNIPVVRKVAESVGKAVASQSAVIDSLRDLSLARSGKLSLQMRTASLRELVESVVRTKKEKAAAKSLALDFQSDGEPLMAVCDPVRIEQIVRNLVGNAIKFTDHGTVSVRLVRDGGFARLSVADTGCGIAPDNLAGVFNAFDQPVGALPRPNRGMGIGLALVQELAAAHDGRVSAESEGAERGAMFTVWLRLAEPLTQEQSKAPKAINPLAGLRVVLVDDSADLLTSFGALLSLEGASVDTFDNGEAALKRLLEGGVDLLISDLGMPGMDGYELISEVRRHPQLSAVPAIALTGYGRTRDPGHAVRSGFNAHTTKPATVEELKNIVSLLKSL